MGWWLGWQLGPATWKVRSTKFIFLLNNSVKAEKGVSFFGGVKILFCISIALQLPYKWLHMPNSNTQYRLSVFGLRLELEGWQASYENQCLNLEDVYTVDLKKKIPVTMFTWLKWVSQSAWGKQFWWLRSKRWPACGQFAKRLISLNPTYFPPSESLTIFHSETPLCFIWSMWQGDLDCWLSSCFYCTVRGTRKMFVRHFPWSG